MLGFEKNEYRRRFRTHHHTMDIQVHYSNGKTISLDELQPTISSRPDVDVDSTLSPSQQRVMRAFLDGDNVFVTGPAGSGKSHLIREIVRAAEERGKKIQCCALTGCAAFLLNVNAKTLHSWAGIGLMKQPDDVIVRTILKMRYKRKRWATVDILVIDEVSMLSHRTFELLDKIGKAVRRSDAPFGGIQVILSGDFYQLAPTEEDFYCFESNLWAKNMNVSINLKEIHRQKDKRFTKILNQIRRGRLSRRSYDTLMACKKKDKTLIPHGIRPTILYPRRFQVDRLNRKKLAELKTAAKVFECRVIKGVHTLSPPYPNKYLIEIQQMTKNAPFDDRLVLREGAQVMCVANLDVENGVCNGSTGIIIGFDSTSGCPVVQFHNGPTRTIRRHAWNSEHSEGISIHQIPLVTAWAITIHKAQGASLDLVEVDVGSSIFAYGQTYVALSRVKTLEGLYLKSFCPEKISVNARVNAFYESLEKK